MGNMYLWIMPHLFDWYFRRSQEYFSYTTAVSIMAEGNLSEPMGKPTPSAGGKRHAHARPERKPPRAGLDLIATGLVKDTWVITTSDREAPCGQRCAQIGT